MNETAIINRMAQLESAVLLMARVTGRRLSREEMCERLGIHRNTLRIRSAQPGFPKPDVNGKYLLSEVLEWEARP